MNVDKVRISTSNNVLTVVDQLSISNIVLPWLIFQLCKFKTNGVKITKYYYRPCNQLEPRQMMYDWYIHIYINYHDPFNQNIALCFTQFLKGYSTQNDESMFWSLH